MDTEQYYASEHPLGRLQECGLVRYMRRELSRIMCPVCKQSLYIYVHKETNDNCFFLCHGCAWFHARPVLFAHLDKAERTGGTATNNGALGKHLDNALRSMLPSSQYRNFKYRNLSGARRNAKTP